MTTTREAIVFTLLLVGLSACSSTDRNVTRDELPPDWRAAIHQPATRSIDIEGVYQDVGERWEKIWIAAKSEGGKLTFPSARSTCYLAGLAGFQGLGKPRPALTIELIVEGTKQIRLIAREQGRVVSEEVWDADWNTEASAWILRTQMRSGANIRASGVEWNRTRLLKGADGRLYLQATGSTVGLLLVFPTSDHEESWARWDAVAPR